MKRISIIIFTILLGLLLTGCGKKNDSILFKEDYESLNGVTNKSGKEHRTVTIDEDNPFVISSSQEIIKKIENKETFYIYFGSKLCPWCRSVIEKAIEIAKNNDIDKIYYVDIWDSEGNEIFRDKYVLNDNGEAVLANEGTDEYFTILNYFNDILPDYTYAANKNGGSELNINEKRIYVPLFVYVVNGEPIRSTSGISDKQTGSRDELTEDILKDEEELFDNFFLNVCDESC